VGYYIMGSEWSYGVTHYDKSNSWTSQVLHDTASGVFNADELPLFTDTSGGTINSATIILDAREGHYIRDQRAGESGYPTKIDFNDRIRITMLDGINTGSYDRVFEVVRKIPIKTKGIGTQLRLECEGIERHLQKVMYSSRRLFDTPKDAFIDLVLFYNEQRTTDMPSLTIDVNELPETGSYHFDWGVNEESVYNRIIELLDSMGNSGEAGGVLDFFEFHIKTSASDVTSMTIDVFSSGHSAPTITIDADSVNTGETDGGIDEAKGTVIGMWGENGKGTLPTDYSRFKARQQFFPSADTNFFHEWVSGESYPANSIVSYQGAVYWTPSLAGTTPPTSPWVLMTPALYYGENNVNNYGSANSVPQYSPWTAGKSSVWKNNSVDPLNTSTYGSGFFDGNMVLNDETTFQTWVHYRTTTGAIPADYEYVGAGQPYFDGLRILVDDLTPAAPFTGTDANGVSYARNVCEYDRDLGWMVKYDVAGDTNLDGMLVAVIESGELFEAVTGAYTDRTADNNTMSWYHPWDSFANVTSLITNPDSGAQWAAPNNNSALEVKYSWKPVSGWFDEVFASRNTVNWLQAGAWLSIMWPLPTNSIIATTEDTGDIYGGGVQGTSGPKEPSAIDAQNMTWTPNGFRGFNINDPLASDIESESLGQLSSIDFLCKLKYEYQNAISTYLLPKGNFKMRAWIFDKNDHVAFQDFVIPFNNETTGISLPLNGFQIYRGRRPRDLGFALNDVLPPKGLPNDDQFEFHHIVGFCFGTLEGYDSQGRYSAGLGTDLGPGLQNLLNLLGVAGIFTGEIARHMTLTIDALRFAKPLLAVTDAVDAAAPIDGITLVKIPEFKQEPGIGNYTQLKNAAKAELQKAHFKKTEYDMQTEIRHNLEFGRFFYFADEEIVDETDNGDNTVKMVAKHIEYSITKPIDGKGGALRRIRGSRRFT
jgi:hypothetical protein